jgi:hypothetical protein
MGARKTGAFIVHPKVFVLLFLSMPAYRFYKHQIQLQRRGRNSDGIEFFQARFIF